MANNEINKANDQVQESAKASVAGGLTNFVQDFYAPGTKVDGHGHGHGGDLSNKADANIKAGDGNILPGREPLEALERKLAKIKLDELADNPKLDLSVSDRRVLKEIQRDLLNGDVSSLQDLIKDYRKDPAALLKIIKAANDNLSQATGGKISLNYEASQSSDGSSNGKLTVSFGGIREGRNWVSERTTLSISTNGDAWASYTPAHSLDGRRVASEDREPKAALAGIAKDMISSMDLNLNGPPIHRPPIQLPNHHRPY